MAGGKTKARPEPVVLDMTELDDLLARVRAAGIPEEDCNKLCALVETVAWLQEELANKSISIARLRSLFGLAGSEKTEKVLAGQVDGDRDQEPGPTENLCGEEDVASQRPGKRKGHGRNGAGAYTGAERVKVPHDSLQPGDPCPSCPESKQGKVYMVRKPSALVRVVGQAPLKATVYELERLRCNLCGEMFVAKAPEGIGDKKYDATAASMIGLLKYGSGMPFNRLHRLEGSLGIPLPAATQWEIVSEAAVELRPVHEELIRQAAQGRLLHNDDTSMQVLGLRKEIDRLKRSGEADRTGIFSTGIVAELSEGRRIALFFTGRKHAGENMAELLQQRAAELESPVQMCDGLDRNLPKELETVLANCLAHGRRKFVELVDSFPVECRFVLETLREVYRHDATAKQRGLSDQERLAYHQEHSRPLMEELESWMREQIEEKRVEPNSRLGGAIGYMQKRWDRLTLFLRVPGAPLDNNVCERALKKAILHRKNSLFYKTENGARIGDLFMSLIHTAELAKVSAFDYLTALLTHAAEVRRDPAAWLPWTYTVTLGEAAGSAPPAP